MTRESDGATGRQGDQGQGGARAAPTLRGPATGESADLEARRLIAAALALAWRDPRSLADGAPGAIPSDLLLTAWDTLAARHADARRGDLGLGELSPALVDARPLAAWLGLTPAEREEAYLRVFGLIVSRECPPYETEYCASRDSFYRAQHMADLTGFFRAFGLAPDPARPERPDHASHHAAFVAFLLEKLRALADASESGTEPGPAEHEAVCRGALASFLQDHVIWWMPTFARCVELRARRVLEGLGPAGSAGRPLDAPGAGDGPPLAGAIRALAGVTHVLRAWVAAERRDAGVSPCRRLVSPGVPDADPDDDTCAMSGVCGGAEAPVDCVVGGRVLSPPRPRLESTAPREGGDRAALVLRR